MVVMAVVVRKIIGNRNVRLAKEGADTGYLCCTEMGDQTFLPIDGGEGETGINLVVPVASREVTSYCQR